MGNSNTSELIARKSLGVGQFSNDNSKLSSRQFSDQIDQDDLRLEELRDLERPKLSLFQIELINKTWKIVKTDMEKVGVIIFIQLFETHPDVRDTFSPFRGLTMDQLRYSPILKAHALRVMGTVEKVLSRIDEKPKLIAMLHELGEKHITYNAKKEFFDLIGPQFLFAIKPCLLDIWTEEIEDAWDTLFKYITHVMREVT